MAVVEIKDGISNLEQKLNSTELDLAQLRRLIQRSLYREMSVAGTASLPLESTITATRSGETTATRAPALASSHCEELNRLSKIWNNLAKPITFIQLLDSLIQTEIEKSLAADDGPTLPRVPPPPQKTMHSPRPKPNANRVFRKASSSRPLKDTTNTHSGQDWSLLSKAIYHDSSEDMFQAVSTSLWTFVNDMKTNMLASLNESPGLAPSPTFHGNAAGDRKADVELLDKCANESDLIDLSPEEEEQEENEEQEEEEEEEELVDLSMYSSMRRKKV